MTINHKGASIFYTDQGCGEPVVLLHGFLENHMMWEPILIQLCEKYRIICIDLLGHGASECTGYVHTMDEMAIAVNTVIEHLEIKEVTIVGHSMGGYVGLAFAKAYSEKLFGLCLLNSTPKPDDAERKELRSRANEMAKKHYEQLVRMSFMNLFEPTCKKAYEVEIDKSLEDALKTTVQGYIAANFGMKGRPDSSDFWNTTTIQKGMILGQVDWIINAELHSDNYKNDTDFFRIIEGGHMLHISNTKEVTKNILHFLEYKNL